MLLLALGSVWLLQDSISEYIQQTYHRASPLSALTDVPGWHAGGLAWKGLHTHLAQANQAIAARSNGVTSAFNQRLVLTQAYHQHQRAQAELVQRQRDAMLQEAALLEAQRYLSLGTHDRVLMAGDSLMQGVAPHLQRAFSQHGITSINASKQSTGLSYPGFFDWPATIAQAVQDDPSIRMVVVLLGPNDPWDMPDPDHRGGPFLKFRSDGWEHGYRTRVARIINNNAAHGLSTLWVGAPGMRADKLDAQMVWLMDVIKDEVETQGAVFLDARSLLPGAGASGGYQDSVDVDGKQVKMRSGDGIHFSTAGQQYLAHRILETLQLPH
ncbi:DUF459 domain-containing protein [Stenotrophomonas rhizophila]